METINTEKPAVAQVPDVPNNPQEDVGFVFLLKASFHIFKRNWLNFIKLTFVLIIPIIIIGALLFWFVGNSAKAAPSLPNSPADTGTVTEETTTIPDENVTPSDENTTPPVGDTVPTAGEPVVGGTDGVTETAPSDTGTADAGTAAPINTEPATTDTGAPVPTLYDTGSLEVTGSPNAVVGSIVVGGMLGSIFGLFTGALLIIMLILILPFIAYQIFVAMAHVRLTVLVTQEQEIKIGEILKWSLRKIGPFIMLSIRIFIYVAWPLLLFPILLLLPLIGIKIGIMDFVSGLVGFAGMIYMIIKSPRCIFAQYALVEKDCTSKEALKDSIEASKGHWWKIIGYVLLLGLLITIINPIALAIFSKIHQLAGVTVSSLISLAGMYITMIFIYGLYNLCKMLNAGKQA